MQAENKSYMNLITDAHMARDTESFIYYSRYYALHLYWNYVRMSEGYFFDSLYKQEII